MPVKPKPHPTSSGRLGDKNSSTPALVEIRLPSRPKSRFIRPHDMPIRQNISGSCHELIVSGKVDGAAANELELEVLRAMKAGATEIYLNLAESDFLCSAGIRVILQYWRQMKQQGKTLLVTQPSTAIDQILTLTGFKESVVEKR
jgi:anti-sigma B factor antagonist